MSSATTHQGGLGDQGDLPAEISQRCRRERTHSPRLVGPLQVQDLDRRGSPASRECSASTSLADRGAEVPLVPLVPLAPLRRDRTAGKARDHTALGIPCVRLAAGHATYRNSSLELPTADHDIGSQESAS